MACSLTVVPGNDTSPTVAPDILSYNVVMLQSVVLRQQQLWSAATRRCPTDTLLVGRSTHTNFVKIYCQVFLFFES